MIGFFVVVTLDILFFTILTSDSISFHNTTSVSPQTTRVFELKNFSCVLKTEHTHYSSTRRLLAGD